jgi:ferredoxin-NADP reductase
MLTEPLTAPTTKRLRIAFGILVGFLFAPALHIGPFYSTPELALIIGNIFAYIVSPKEKLFLKLKERKKIGTDTFNFVFQKDKNFHFQPGQYMEWTLKHRSPDTRGNRRYFTIASSPTEEEIHLGVKFYPEPSSFKNRLLALPIGEEIVAAQRSGDFVLPKKQEQGLVFIAGGIGITPFRSMIQYLLDKHEKREITLFYSNKKISDISYKEVFDKAQAELGIKTIYTITDKDEKILDVSMQNKSIDSEMIQKEVPQYLNKTFYISGPHGMVNAFENTLKSMGVHRKNIKIDFFPGFA